MVSMLSLKKYNKRLVQMTRESRVRARKPATAVVSAPGRFYAVEMHSTHHPM